jgi:hypothetical protein
MRPRELVELAKALTESKVEVRKVILSVESDAGMLDFEVHSNDDLFRPIHVDGVAFDDCKEAVEFIESI